MLKDKVTELLDDVRPSLQADGGDVELVDVEDNGVVKVRLQGACHGCPHAQMTVKTVIENYLKEQIPEVTAVESVV